jgi:hypothetical protein
MTRAQTNALDSARYFAGLAVLAPTEDDANELVQLAGEWLAVVRGKPVRVTAETVHGIISNLSQSGIVE